MLPAGSPVVTWGLPDTIRPSLPSQSYSPWLEPGPAGALELHFHLRVRETLLAWAASLQLGTLGFDAMWTSRFSRLSLGISGCFCTDPDPRRMVKVGEPGEDSGPPWFTTGPGERGAPSSLVSAVPREGGVFQGGETHRISLLLHL